MVIGETVCCVADYDLFDYNINGEHGCYIRYSGVNGKHIIHFPCNGEWAELFDYQFVRVNKPGYVSTKYKDFIRNVSVSKVGDVA